MMEQTPPQPSDHLSHALSDIFLHPVRTLLPAWSWKAAGISAVIRAALFFATNLREGRSRALHAMAVEAVFAIFAAGLMGAGSQRMRGSRPQWATALVVWFLMPAIMLTVQLGVHRLAGTAHVNTGLIASFFFAALASSFSWYAMSRGAMLGGSDSTSLRHDLAVMPRILVDFLLAGPRALLRWMRGERL